jgi:hypothetical protein
MVVTCGVVAYVDWVDRDRVAARRRGPNRPGDEAVAVNGSACPTARSPPVDKNATARWRERCLGRNEQQHSSYGRRFRPQPAVGPNSSRGFVQGMTRNG